MMHVSLRRIAAPSIAAVLALSSVACVRGSGESHVLEDVRAMQQATAADLRRSEQRDLTNDRSSAESLAGRAKQALRAALGDASVSGTRALTTPTASENIQAVRRAKVKVSLVAKPRAGATSPLDVELALDSPLRDARGLVTLSGAMKNVSWLDDQVRDLNGALAQANIALESSTLMTLLHVSAAALHRAEVGMDLDDEDLDLVAERIALWRRHQAVAGATLGMLAVYQATLAGTGDPKAVDTFATHALASLAEEPKVSRAEARRYIDEIPETIGRFEASVDAMIAARPGSDADRQQLREVYAVALRGPRMMVEMRAKQAVATTAPAEETPATAPRAARGSAVAKRAIDEASARGTATLTAAALGKLEEVLPPDGAIRKSIEGTTALIHGDPRKALAAAIDLLPVGGIAKDGLHVAQKLIFD